MTFSAITNDGFWIFLGMVAFLVLLAYGSVKVAARADQRSEVFACDRERARQERDLRRPLPNSFPRSLPR